MAITWDTAAASGGSNGGANGSRTITTYTVNSGSNRVIYAVVAYSDKSGTSGNVTITGVTWDGVALTSVSGPTQKVTGYTHIWRLKQPNTGNKNLVVSWNATTNDPLVVHILSAQDVDQTTTDHNFTSSNGTGTAVSTTVTSASGEDVVDAAILPEASSTLTSGGTAEFSNSTSTANGDPIRLAVQRTNGAASVATSWTAGSSTFWLDVGFSVIPASGAASQWNQQTSDQWNRIVQGAQ